MRLPRPTLSVLAVTLCLASTARADRFHFGDPDADELRARVIEGVLLEETDSGDYRIRVEGGEITISKALVTKRETDGLTVAQIEQREADAREALARADQERQAMLAAAAADRREAQAVEASANTGGDAVEATVPVVVVDPAPVYDPIIRRTLPLESIVEQELRRELGGSIRRIVQRQARQIRRDLRRTARRLR